MKLGHIELFVADPLASKEFYRRVLGFEILEVQGGRCVWMKLGDITFVLRPGEPPRVDAYQKAGAALVLYTDDLSSALNALSDRGLTPAGTDGSPLCPTFTDLDGNWFQLVDPRQQV
ncbi:VOC family protein [Bradyrhizobium barranii]|uniref:VOC family protein n=1 Tax=Bradyrhizobium barranii TaxID=2992140 RepID=UPI003CCAE060